MSDTADFSRDVDGDSTLFQVVPADAPRFWPLIAIGVAVLYFGFSGVSFLLVFTVAGVCIALGWNDLRPIEHRTPARFRVSPSGIEALGETFRKAHIEELAVGKGGGTQDEGLLGKAAAKIVTLEQASVDAVTHALLLRVAGRSVLLPGESTPRRHLRSSPRSKTPWGPASYPILSLVRDWNIPGRR